MRANDLAKLEAAERLKIDDAIQRTQIRKKILKEKIISWMRRHPIVTAVLVVLIVIQFANAYFTMDRMDRKTEAQESQTMWRGTLETK